MRRSPWQLVAATAALATLLAARSPDPAPDGGALQPLVTLTGADSRITDARCLRITTPEEWAALWLEHLGHAPVARYDTFHNEAGLPIVDFDTCMVVAVFAGATENCAGFEVWRDKAQDGAEPAGVDDARHVPAGPGERAFRYSRHSYQTVGPDGGGRAATPYAFFFLPRTPAPLLVQEVPLSMGGRPVRHIERGRFPALR
jgi:hypothetical protein